MPATPGNVNDATVFPATLAGIRRYGFDFAGHLFDADKEYDADYNCEVRFWIHMISHIKQRKHAVNRSEPSRTNVIEMFDHDEHGKSSDRRYLRG